MEDKEILPDLMIFAEKYIVLILACLVSYVFGALPVAYRLSRRKGVDIFTSGTGLAGASNVMKSVGRTSGLLVLVFDMAKGVLAIIIVKIMGIEGLIILIPGLVAVFGHWNSIFTRFRGGDGMAIGAGITIAVIGPTGLIAFLATAVVIMLAQKLHFSSLFGVVVGYPVLLLLNLNNYEQVQLVFGLAGIAVLILVHALRGHRRRNRGGVGIS